MSSILHSAWSMRTQQGNDDDAIVSPTDCAKCMEPIHAGRDDNMNIATFYLRNIKVWIAFDFMMSTVRTLFHGKEA